MNSPALQDIVNAVLYEGYILYPYRASAKKNLRERFTFGRVYPEAYSAAQMGAEPCLCQTQCLATLITGPATLHVSVGFLQPVARRVGAVAPGQRLTQLPNEADLEWLPELRVDNEIFQAWHEAVEQQITIPPLLLGTESTATFEYPFCFPGTHRPEPIRNLKGELAGMFSRRSETLAGKVELQLERLGLNLFQVTVRVVNQTPINVLSLDSAEEVLLRTMASTHTILQLQTGQFVSLMDPPEDCRGSAEACKNIGTWPVLVGDELNAERSTMLSSPIILYDYPKIAPESAGSLFDGAEIDELLSLRIRTLTDEEKREMRGVDQLARELLERTENLPDQSLLRMHGVMRENGSTPVMDFFKSETRLESVQINGTALRAGSRVRIRPKVRADIMDIALDGKIAVVEAVEQDAEQKVYLAVVFENDPGRDLGFLRQPGHRFFYGVDEVELLEANA